MTPKLSIIIPCYNCKKTLSEAVASCYTQDLDDDAFEIIMVDDGSSDTTRQVMESLAQKHPNITMLFHPKNRGGGAARNTGIAAAKYEIIYCLDSDNFFAPHSVKPMLNYLTENNLDGVAFYERRFFSNSNTRSFEPRYNLLVSRLIKIEDLFAEQSIMLDNFFYTKEAYEKTNRYPEHHGFDTQTFEIDFLARKLKTRVCPNSIFYHRQNQSGHKSYYEREYEKGLLSINTYLSLEPIFPLLNDGLIHLIINFDVFRLNYHGDKTNLLSEISHYVREGNPLLQEDRHKRNRLAQVAINLVHSMTTSEFEKALGFYGETVKVIGLTPFLLYFSMRISYGLQGVHSVNLDSSVYTFLKMNNIINFPRYTRIPHILNPLLKLIIKLRK